MDDKVRPRTATALAPVIFVVFLVVLAGIRPGAYSTFIKEDGVVEYATCLAYLGAAVLSFLVSRRSSSSGRTYHGLFLMTFAGLLFLVAMEEISWGQRLFGFGTPRLIADHNVQGELTLHNLGDIQQTLLHLAYMLVGFAASVGPLLIPGFIKDRWPGPWRALVPPPRLFFYFFPAFAFYFVNELVHPYTRNAVLDWLRGLIGRTDHGYAGGSSWAHQEPVELLLAAGFLLLTWQAYTGVQRQFVAKSVLERWKSAIN